MPKHISNAQHLTTFVLVPKRRQLIADEYSSTSHTTLLTLLQKTSRSCGRDESPTLPANHPSAA